MMSTSFFLFPLNGRMMETLSSESVQMVSFVKIGMTLLIVGTYVQTKVFGIPLELIIEQAEKAFAAAKVFL